MKFKIILELFLLLGFCGLIWLGIYHLDFSSEEEVSLLSIEKEEEIGELIFEEILKQSKEVENEIVQTAIETIKDRLLDAYGDTIYNYKFVVIQDEMINAFNIPGGYVILTSGLIQFVESAEQITAIIAHEMGHAEKKHVVNKIVKEIGINILFSLAGGDAVLLSEVTRLMGSTAFDRKLEKEADQFAMELLVKAKINPRVLASFFRKLKETGRDSSEAMKFFTTHPSHSSRIRSALEFKLDSNFEEEPLSIDWEKIQTALK